MSVTIGCRPSQFRNIPNGSNGPNQFKYLQVLESIEDLPTELKPNAVYFVRDGDSIDMYVVNSDGSAYEKFEITNQVFTVENIAELKEFEGFPGIIVIVRGYYEEGDGGGGEFYWHPTSTDTDNEGTIIQATGVVTGRWIRIVYNSIILKYFGAKGDGTTDDTFSVQNALNVAQSLGKKVQVTKGTYLIETVYLPQSIEIEGDNSNESTYYEGVVFKQKTTNDVFRLLGVLNAGNYWWYGKLTNFKILGQTSSTTGNGINCIDDSSNAVLLQDVSILKNLIIRAMGENGILCRGAMPAVFDTIKFLFNEGSGIKFLGNTQYLGVGLHNISGDGNEYLLHFENNIERDNFSIVNIKSEYREDASHGGSLKQFNAIYINNCSGTYDINGGNHISSVIVSGTREHPGDFIKVVGTNKPKITWTGVNIRFISGSTGATPAIIDAGVFLESEVDYTVKNGSYNSKSGHLISEEINYRIAIPDLTATPDMTGVSIGLISNTVATTITNILGGRDCKIIQLLFTTSNSKIISNANIVLNENFYSNGNSSLTLIYFGGVWKELSRAEPKKVGTATLVSGTVTVNTTKVTSSSIILLSRNSPIGTLGNLSAPSASIVSGTSFVINSSSASDNSTVYWHIIN